MFPDQNTHIEHCVLVFLSEGLANLSNISTCVPVNHTFLTKAKKGSRFMEDSSSLVVQEEQCPKNEYSAPTVLFYAKFYPFGKFCFTL